MSDDTKAPKLSLKLLSDRLADAERYGRDSRVYTSRDIARLADRCDGLAEQAASRIDKEKLQEKANETRFQQLYQQNIHINARIDALVADRADDDVEPERDDERDELDDAMEAWELEDKLDDLRESMGAKIVLGTLVGFLGGLIVGGGLWAYATMPKAVEAVKPLILT